MMKSLRLAAALVLTLGLTLPANAQSYGLATSSPGDSVHSMGVAIAEAAREAGVDLRVTPFKATSQALPLVGSGQVAFGLGNAYELQMADSGTVMFEGRQVDGLRLVAALYPFKMGLMVRADSDITEIPDLKGRPVPSGFGTTATGNLIVSGLLGASGLTYDDVEAVNVSSFGDMKDAFESGRIDTMIGIVGSGRDAQIARNVGGIRVLGIPDTAAATDALRSFVPVARPEPVSADEDLNGIRRDINTLAYDYYLYASASTPDDVVASVLEAIVDGQDDLRAAVPSFRWFDLKRIGASNGLPFHDGAKAVLGERGLLTSE